MALTPVKNKDVPLPTPSYIYFKFIYFLSFNYFSAYSIISVLLIGSFMMTTSPPHGSPSTLHPVDSILQTIPIFLSLDYQVEYTCIKVVAFEPQP